MKMYLISDNVDTQTGMRLAGVEGVVVHTARNWERRWRKPSRTRKWGFSC